MTVPTAFPVIDAATTLKQQRRAFLNDGPPDLKRRKATLAKLRAAVLAHRKEVEDAISSDFGNRSKHETDIMELLGVVQSIDYLQRNLRHFMKRERRHVAAFHRMGHAYVDYQPKGVVGVMAPWNYPFALTFIPVATALAAGNRVMIKPSELTPRTSDLIQRILASSFSTEEVAVVIGGPETGASFSALPFDHLLFTGSTQVGRKVMRAASDNLVPLTLELGGKSPAVVAPGHAAHHTLESITFGKLSNAGQTCVAPDYALVHEDDLGQFITQYHAAVVRSYPQGPISPDYTSIVSDRHHARLQMLIEDARVKGATVLEMGMTPERATERLRTMPPMLIVDAPDDALVMQEEIFGPLLPIRTYRTFDEVIEYINSKPRPLALYYFGDADADRDALLRHTTSGNVGINNTLLHVAVDDLPFGGVGPSGMGAYHGIEGFRSMSHAKGVFVQRRWNLPSLLRPPFGKLVELAIGFTLRT